MFTFATPHHFGPNYLMQIEEMRNHICSKSKFQKVDQENRVVEIASNILQVDHFCIRFWPYQRHGHE